MPTLLSAEDLPSVIRAAIGDLAGRARYHDVYDEVGAPIYDDLSRGDTHEVREIVGLVRRTTGDVLDLAAGTGRLTLPLLATGRDVVALELSSAMLSGLRGRLADGPERLRHGCTVVRADMRDFDLDRSFGAVVLGTTSISLLDRDGRRSMCRSVLKHLEADGRFLVSTVGIVADDPEGVFDRHVTGASGTDYRMLEALTSDGASRFVAIVDVTDGVRICCSQVNIVPAERLVEELVDAGFVVAATHAVRGGSERYPGTLVEAALPGAA